MTYRVLTLCEWSPDGHSRVLMAPGDVLTENDPRAEGGFVTVALREGWIEPLTTDPAPPTRAVESPAAAKPSPAKARRSSPRRKQR